MAIQKLSKKNQIVIPKEAREAMKIKGGDELLIVVKGEITIIIPRPEAYYKSLSGIGSVLYGDSKKYLAAERNSWGKD